MDKKIPFTKMNGTGNDFIVFDNRERYFEGTEYPFFREICQRRISIGADGVLLLEKGTVAPVRMRYYNADGFESTMCGNGARCTGYFAWKQGAVTSSQFDLEAADGVHSVRIDKDFVTLGMVKPRDYTERCGILQEPEFEDGGFLNTGVPHFVILVSDLDSIDVEHFGAYYRRHEYFPEGTNVNFVQVVGDQSIRVRTYERGVEAETLSCGTGCVASALLTSRREMLISPIQVMTRGGDLMIHFDESWEEITLSGKVTIVFEGSLTHPIM